MQGLRIIGFVMAVGIMIAACQSENQPGENKSGQETTQMAPPFALDTTLLAPPLEIEPCQKTFRPPLGFDPIPINELANLKARFRETVQRRLVELEAVLANDSRGAGIMVFSVGALFIHSDTSKLFDSYRNSLVGVYRGENLSELSYWLDDSIYVKDFRLTDSVTLRHNVFALSRHGKAMEIQYIMPHRAAGSLLPAVKSSMVSFRRSADYPYFDSLATPGDAP